MQPTNNLRTAFNKRPKKRAGVKRRVSVMWNGMCLYADTVRVAYCTVSSENMRENEVHVSYVGVFNRKP